MYIYLSLQHAKFPMAQWTAESLREAAKVAVGPWNASMGSLNGRLDVEKDI